METLTATEAKFQVYDRKLEITDSSDEFERFEDMNPFQIQKLETVPYYLIPTMNDCPLIDFCDEKYYVIDGCNLVKEAIDNNAETIKCRVRYRGEMTEREMTSRKVGSRLRTPGGETSYADHVRVLKSYTEYLLKSDNNFYLPIHGGDRRSADSNPDKNIFNVLVEEMNKSKPVIEKLVRHGQYINDETLLTLAQNKVPRDFFDWVQPKKNGIISQFKTSINEDLIDEKITEHISTFMLEAYNEWPVKQEELKAKRLAVKLEKCETKQQETENSKFGEISDKIGEHQKESSADDVNSQTENTYKNGDGNSDRDKMNIKDSITGETQSECDENSDKSSSIISEKETIQKDIEHFPEHENTIEEFNQRLEAFRQSLAEISPIVNSPELDELQLHNSLKSHIKTASALLTGLAMRISEHDSEPRKEAV